MKRRQNAIGTISSFIKATLPIYGMVSKRDFVVSDDHVKLSKHPQRGRVLAILKQEYPQYTFYWMTPKCLRGVKLKSRENEENNKNSRTTATRDFG